MVYYVGTLEQVSAVNMAEAAARGCTGVTKYWWAARRNQDGTQWALEIDGEIMQGELETVTKLPPDFDFEIENQ